MGEYGNFIEKEILNRNKIIDAVNKQVEIIKSDKQNSTGILLGKSKILQHIRAEENQNAIEELKLKTSRLKNENKEIEKFQKELRENNDQFQQQVAIKKKQLFKGLLPVRIQQFIHITH